MGWNVVWAALAGALGLGVASATAAVITDPDWAMRPAGEDLAANYPEVATALGVEGYAKISCDVAASGLLANCSVMKEGPAGFGFGAAALRMTSKFRMKPMQADGTPVAGGDVQIPIRFVLPTPPALAPRPPMPTDRGLFDLAQKLVAAQARPEAREFFIKSRVAEFRAKARRQSDSDVIEAAMAALSAAATWETPAQLEEMALIYASTLPAAELETHLAYQQTPAASAFLAQQAELAKLHRRQSIARYNQVRWDANRIFCAQHDCRSEADFPSGRAPPGGPKMIYSPTWVQKADIAQVFGAYPPVAKTLGIDGWGGLVCRADHLGLLSDCRMAAESPAGLGFGAAALALASHYRLQTSDSDASGAEVWLTMRFRRPALPRSPIEYPGAPESRLVIARQVAASEPIEMNFAWSDELWRRQRDQSPAGAVSPALFDGAEKAWRSAMELEHAASQEAVASFWASFMDEQQLGVLLAHRQSSAWREFPARQRAMSSAIEAAEARSNQRVQSKARDIFCKTRDCQPPRELKLWSKSRKAPAKP